MHDLNTIIRINNTPSAKKNGTTWRSEHVKYMGRTQRDKKSAMKKRVRASVTSRIVPIRRRASLHAFLTGALCVSLAFGMGIISNPNGIAAGGHRDGTATGSSSSSSSMR